MPGFLTAPTAVSLWYPPSVNATVGAQTQEAAQPGLAPLLLGVICNQHMDDTHLFSAEIPTTITNHQLVSGGGSGRLKHALRSSVIVHGKKEVRSSGHLLPFWVQAVKNRVIQ